MTFLLYNKIVKVVWLWKKISKNLKSISSITKVLSIISIVISLLMIIIGFMFKEIIDGIENNNQNQDGDNSDMMTMGIMALIYMFFLLLASLRFVGVGLMIVSILFLLSSIICKKYSFLEISELRKRIPILIGIVIIYLLPALLLMIFSIIMTVDVGFIAFSLFIVPIVLFSVGGYNIIKTIILINKYKEEKIINLETSNVRN
jgi:hypothetical protein